MDYLTKPNKDLATPAEEEALGTILAQCVSSNTALLQLYRVAVIAQQEVDDLVDEIERLGQVHQEECLRLQGKPIDTSGRNPLRPAQP